MAPYAAPEGTFSQRMLGVVSSGRRGRGANDSIRAAREGSPEGDLERGNLLGPTMSSRVSDVYFPELMDEERSKCKALKLLHPEGPRLRVWQILILALVSFSAVWVPFEFGFIPNPPVPIMYLDFVVDLFFLVDMMLIFATAYRCPKTLRLVTNRGAIAKRYLLGGFFPDLLSSIPYNTISFWVTGSPMGGALGAFFRLLGCLRLYRFPMVYHELSNVGRLSYSTFLTIRLVKLLLNILLASHYAAVLYFWLTTMEPNPEETWMVDALGNDWPNSPVFLQYMATMWWSIFVITSIGPAYTAVSVPEQIFSCFYALFGMAALSYTLGTLTLLMVKSSSSTLEYHEDLDALRAFSARNNLPPEFEKQLKDQLQLRLLQKKAETESFISNLPLHLRVAITRHIHLPVVQGIPDFRECSKAFLNQVVAACQMEVVTRGAVVTMAGDVATHLYIVVSGKLIREHAEDSPVQNLEQALLHPGSVFGKTAVLMDSPQLFTVRALETSQLLRLCKKDFQAIMEAYPSDCANILSKLKKKLESSNCNSAGQTSPDITGLLQRSMSEEALRSAADISSYSAKP